MLKQLYKNAFSEKTRIGFRYFFYKLRALFYYGSQYSCNCCGHGFRKFLPKGNIPRPNSECPLCGSLERNRLLLFYLQNETEVFSKKLRILHFSPERCISLHLKKADIEYFDGDINPAVASRVIDITAIPFPAGFFDLIICSHVLGHVPDEEKAIAELHRVVKKGGMALLLTLLDTKNERTFEDAGIKTPAGKLANYGEPDLCRLHGMDFAGRIRAAGFQVTAVDYRKNFNAQVQQRYSLGDGTRELIFKCVK